MKKATIAIIAVAILGLLGFRAQHKTSANGSAASGAQATLQAPVSGQSSGGSVSSQTTNNSNYKDGTFSGSASSTPYGNVQVAAVISGGKISDIKFLQMPNSEGESMMRTSFSEPLLKRSAINNQSANIDFVTGATDTSFGFEQSLQAALNQASA